MLSSTASALLRLAGWSYLPNFATRRALGLVHHFLRSRGYSSPAFGTVTWQKHYRYTYAMVVLGYLSYNLVEAWRSTPNNFYEILSVTPEADENTLKYAFRAFARKNHPDRVGPQGEAMFIVVRDAFEALKNPTTRFAYDRFGPEAMKWRDCSAPKEFLNKGLLQASGFYICSGLILLFMSAALKPSPVAFWRYVLFASLFSLEIVAFQHILFLHQLFLFLGVSLSHVIPVLFPQNATIRAEDPRTYAPFIDRLTILAQVVDREASRMLHIELHALHGVESTATFSELTPCVPSEAVMDTLAREMEDMIVENHLRREAPIRPLWATALDEQRRKMEMEDNVIDGHEEDNNSSTEGSRNGRLPSPPGSVSPVGTHVALDGHSNGEVVQAREYEYRLPSPRPSPPPFRPG